MIDIIQVKFCKLKHLLFIFAITTGAIGGASAIAQTQAIDQVIAIVDSEAITLSEYVNRHERQRFEDRNLGKYSGQVDPRILEAMIDERIQAAQAKSLGIQVSEGEIDGAMQLIAQQNNLTIESLIDQIENDGFTYDQFRETLRTQQLIRKLIDAVANSRVVVSDLEIENYLNAHSELRSSDESYEISHLIVLTQGKSDEEIKSERENMEFIRKAITEGQPFEQAVMSFSDASNKDDKGYLGWRTSDQLPELFIDALRGMDPATASISGVLQSDNGLHLLKLHDRKGSGKLIEQQLVNHILVQPNENNTSEEAEALALDLYQQLQNGESFEKLARLYSDDAQSRRSGGSLGWIGPGDVGDSFRQAAESLPVGSISQPVKTRFGFHIIQVVDRRQTDMSNQNAEDRAREEIFRRKAEELYSNWFRAVREQAFVEYVGA